MKLAILFDRDFEKWILLNWKSLEF